MERLVAVFSRDPLPADRVRSALASEHPALAPIPGAEDQVAYELVKDPR